MFHLFFSHFVNLLSIFVIRKQFEKLEDLVQLFSNFPMDILIAISQHQLAVNKRII